MSRAFVDEDASRDDEVPEIPLPLPPGARNYLTPEGALRLQGEFRGLLDSGRPALEAEIARLSASDDSADLDALSSARRRLATADRRIEYLGRMASLAEVVEPAGVGDRVVFGSTVRVREGGGTEASYRIVGVDESDPERGLLSWASPVARALMGRKPGDTALLHLPGGDRSLEILGIEHKERTGA